jgi:hypothetical protein
MVPRYQSYAMILPLLATSLLAAQSPHPGREIYAKHCASCHGENGEGVEEECDEPLQGERSLASLIKYIDKNMPEDEPHLVVGEDARLVSEYIMGAFYSAEARSHQPAPAKSFARLTNRQFRESVADLLSSFGPHSQAGDGSGLKAQYFQSDGMNKKAKMVMEKTDTALSFDFGEVAPCDGINAEQFSIAWDGSLLAPATGWYEFKIFTSNGARLYLNGIPQDGDGNHRDDSGGKRQEAFIDAWVSSGANVRENGQRIFLLAGRTYPLRLDYFKYKEKNGMIRVEWKRPRGAWEVLSAPYLSPSLSHHVAVVSTDFPADDASEGYERGTGVSKAWHEATTAASINAANQVVEGMYRLSGIKHDDPELAKKFRDFLIHFAERAFRTPLNDEMKDLYVHRMFAEGVSLEQSIKRAVILILKSPRFLYPEIRREKDDYTIATRLALGIWDSLPDEELLKAAREGRLRQPDVQRQQAQRMMNDPRARSKMQEFFHRWLKLDDEGDMQKNQKEFPGFDDNIVADLRVSLERFIEHVVWNEASDYRQLMLADYLFINDRLSQFYQITANPQPGFQLVKVDPAQRTGVITHPYLMAKLAHADTTSPIHRGVFLTRNVLGGILKPPPKAIAFENQKFDPNLTIREKIVQLTRSTDCMSCHETINPLGFSLEHFDAIGRFRTTDGQKPVNAEAEYNSLEGDSIHLRGARDVAQHAIDSASARRGFIRQMLQTVVKQNAPVYGSDVLHKLDQTFITSAYNMRKLFLEINLLTAVHGIPSAQP